MRRAVLGLSIACVLLPACARGGGDEDVRLGRSDSGRIEDASVPLDGTIDPTIDAWVDPTIDAWVDPTIDAFVPPADAPPAIDAGPACASAGCDPLATCSDATGTAVCTCPPGYSDPRGDGTLCTDVDECMTGTAGCSAMATCANTPGSVTCTCIAGYSGDGRTCADVDECMTGAAGCSPFATCANTPGSATCTCMPGYSGDGRTCTPAAGRLLVYDDHGSTVGAAAASSIGWTSMVTTDGPSFAAAFDGGGWSVVMIDSSYDNLPGEVTTRVSSFAGSGGRMIFSYWDLDADFGSQSALQVSAGPDYTTPRTVHRDAASAYDFFAGLPASMTGTDGVYDDGDPITPTAGGYYAARLDSPAGPGALVVTRSNRVIVAGFSFYNFATTDGDFDGVPDLRELVANMLRYLGP